MARDREPDFEMLLSSPDAYSARCKGFTRAIAAGVPPDMAARMCGLTQDELAGALTLKKLGRAVGRAGRGVGRGARFALRTANPIYVTTRTGKLAAKGLAAATRGLRRKIFRALFGKLAGRRASLLAWQRRGSLQPTRAEGAEALGWTRAYLRRKGAFGKLVVAALSGDVGAEPVSASLITVSIPLLIALAKKVLKQAQAEGAPADPTTTPEAPSLPAPAAEQESDDRGEPGE